MASYERLADSAFAAAMDMKRYVPNTNAPIDSYKNFVRLLQEPIEASGTYKLLYDPRNLPLYKSAWSSVFDNASNLKAPVFLKRVSELLTSTQVRLESNKSVNTEEMARFCLMLNKVFLEENANKIASGYNMRMTNAVS